ncbi:unnamed protein product [Parascedosporium putredinis]|uniref:Acyl-CoA dehydrogenase n=1 Tax=Parascedosporium putredinis TaxID=1442378 RepID=A0A9P1H0S7_9PEZI|nr:unnamed protein product [Parascedosporium putredinis]CAI7992983.1 unnamed protein product [Parascedosporium putredinis]
MSARIPAIALDRVSERARKTLDVVAKFPREHENLLITHTHTPHSADPVLEAQIGEGDERWKSHPAIIEELKKRARALGLWNMFFPKGHYKESPGFSNLEYGLMAEWLGRSRVASEATNCAAPDTGNMEVLAKYGNEAQKQRWLAPLMEGKIRSAFLMTEPDVASSDATNIQLTMTREGNEYVLNGSKWWSSGAGDPRCQIYIVMGKSDPKNADTYKQQSVILVPSDTPGITIHRMLQVYGYDDAPTATATLPSTTFASIGAAERALDWMLMRINDPKKTTFGKQLKEHGVILEWVARSRIEIDAARLLVLNAAIKMDTLGPKAALKEIAEAKVMVPQMALTVIDRAIRTLRLADGPDEVHLRQMGRNEAKRGKETAAMIQWQNEKTAELFKIFGGQKYQPGTNIVKSKI